MRTAILVTLFLLLAGCATAPPCTPRIVYQTVEVPVAVPVDVPAIDAPRLLLPTAAAHADVTVQELLAAMIHDLGELRRYAVEASAVLEAIKQHGR